MKLLAKYNRVNIIATIIVLLLSAVIYYLFIEAALIHQLDKNLVVEENEINEYIAENKQLPEATISKEEQDIFTQTNSAVERRFSSVQVQEDGDRESKVYRQIEFPLLLNGRFYKADVRKSQEETEDLVQLILKITLAIVVLLLATLFIINRFILNKLWKPFNSTLQQIKRFNLTATDKVVLEPTNINEFKELNGAVYTMTKRVSQDYNEIKSFTENASHEIQTPLAIISSKLELLSQSENLKEEQMQILQSIAETTNRLSKLNQSLILLTKIDNRQFMETGLVDISSIVIHHLNNYEELLHAKNIALTKKIQPNVLLRMNETLAEILILNLLTNSIKHNIDNGKIDVVLSNESFSIRNTGKAPRHDTHQFFERFMKESDSNESLGLGLSIVNKICNAYNFDISYKFAENLHNININFKQNT